MNGNRDQGRRGNDPHRASEQRQGGGHRPEARTATDVSWVREVIEKEDYPSLDKKAAEIGKALGDDATRTQVRVIFGTVKRLEGLKGRPDALKRELIMLRPRLAYTAARVKGLDALRDVLSEASKLVEQDASKRTQRLVDLMEAILCYSYASERPSAETREAHR